MTKVSNEKLSTQVAGIMQKLCGLAVEIDELRKKNQKTKAENKVKELKNQVVQLLGVDEAELKIAEAAINQDAGFFNQYLVGTLIMRLNQTEFFDEIEDAMVQASLTLRDEPFDLVDDESLITQKFGFMVAVHKKINDPSKLLIWTKSLVDYLTKDLGFNVTKSQDINDQLVKQNDELAERFFNQVVCLLYISKLAAELDTKKYNFMEPKMADVQEQFDDKRASLIQLLKHVEAITDLKESGSKDVSKLEQEWAKFNTILEQTFNATAVEVHEIGLALDEGMDKFKDVFGPFMIDKLQEQFPMDEF